MKFFILVMMLFLTAASYSQKLELINVDNVKELPLGQGVQLEIRLAIDEVKLDNSKYEFISDPKLTSKFIVVPKELGLHKIGPIISGDLMSNTIEIEVLPLIIKNPIYLSVPDSSVFGEDIKLIVTNTSKNEGYSIKEFKMKSNSSFEIIGESYSVSISKSDTKVVKKETLLITIKPRNVGEIRITSDSFDMGEIEDISIEEKVVVVY